MISVEEFTGRFFVPVTILVLSCSFALKLKKRPLFIKKSSLRINYLLRSTLVCDQHGTLISINLTLRSIELVNAEDLFFFLSFGGP